jgi:crotonobetainyl-CoA:carnitine CoA-transferase CaiB-like acyl-CoA transferase
VEHPELGEIHLVAQPFTLSGHANKLRTATPACGQDTDAVLADLGYGPNEIESMRRANIV